MPDRGRSEKFRKTLWPRIDDAASALQAMQLAQWAGLLIAIGYGFALVLAFATGRYPDGTPFEDEAELIGIVFIYAVLILLALAFWFLPRRGYGWAVLVVCVWGLLEALLKLLSAPGGAGIVLTVLLVLFCLGGIRGWLGLRKYGRPAVPPAAAKD